MLSKLPYFFLTPEVSVKLSVAAKAKPNNIQRLAVIMMVCNDVTAIPTFGTGIRPNQFTFACCSVNSGKSVSSLGISLPIFNLSIVKLAIVLLVTRPLIFFATLTTMACESIIVTPDIIKLSYRQVSLAHPASFLSCR
jgi:hypothetical protein